MLLCKYIQVVEYCYPFVKEKLSHEEKVLREVNYYIHVLKRAQTTGDYLYNNYIAVYNFPTGNVVHVTCMLHTLYMHTWLSQSC